MDESASESESAQTAFEGNVFPPSMILSWMNEWYAGGIYSDLLLVINTSYLSPEPGSSASYSIDFPPTPRYDSGEQIFTSLSKNQFLFSDLTLGLNVQMGKAFGIEAKTVKWSEWNLFCSEHNDGTQFKSVSYANLSVWEMEVFSFRKYTSRWDCSR